MSVSRSSGGVGKKVRLGQVQAVVATEHLSARVVHRMLKYKVDYHPLSVEEYEKHYREQQIKYLELKAAKLGFLLSPACAVSKNAVLGGKC